MRTILLALIFSVGTLAYATAPSKVKLAAAQVATQDPVASFKELITSASTPSEWTAVQQNAHSKKWSKQHFIAGEVKFDVKKTDSLISPVQGIVTFPVTMRMSDFFDTRDEADTSTPSLTPRTTSYLTGDYLFIDGKWQLDKFSYRVTFTGEPPDHNVTFISRDQLAAKLGTGTGIALMLEKWFR